MYVKKLPKVNQICANIGICPMGKIHSFVLKTILLYLWIFSYCCVAGKNHSKLNLVNRTGHLLESGLTSQNNVNEITKLIFKYILSQKLLSLWMVVKVPFPVASKKDDTFTAAVQCCWESRISVLVLAIVWAGHFWLPPAPWKIPLLLSMQVG